MNKTTLLLILIFVSSFSFAQRSDKDWFASVGLNSINSLGTRSPFNSPGDWANGLPLSLGVELIWDSGLSIEQAFTLNKFPEGNTIDGVTLKEDFTYTSFDTHVKYYFGKHILPDVEWLEIYANSGLGLFSVDEVNLSFNLGGGVLVWFNRRKTLGARLQTIGKFAFNHKDSGFDNNHFQSHLQLIFAL
ncbi:hypothetical protein [uncultured Winogradskyella sp.]|uniref:hypothetical protein n=1 Tax=uncultured Winogradskyella sp. TaxID=395353 RepID=UPI00262BC364|nr:hypothetical protein [uncultured Winogradskyella sp.]